MNNSSIPTFYSNQQGPSRRTLKRRLEKICEGSAAKRVCKEGSVESVYSSIVVSPVINRSEISSDTVIAQSTRCNNIIEDIETLGFQVHRAFVQPPSPLETEPRTSSFLADTENIDSINSVFEDMDTRDPLEKFLRLWSLKYNIKNKPLTELLQNLRTICDHNLPSDARTLKSTPRKITTRAVEPGYYWHFGIKRMLEILKSKAILLPGDLTLNVNIDGVPLYKSSKQVFWPILGKIVELKNLKPFVIGIYYHESTKPKDLHSYLEDFVSEMHWFTKNQFCESKIHPGLFIMDAPAMAFAKQTISHNGKKACGKCEVVGKKIGRMCFTKIKNKKRTDTEFRIRSDKEHHNIPEIKTLEEQNTDHDENAVDLNENNSGPIKGPLEMIEGVDMIESFAIDSLHVIYLGVVKKKLQMNNDKLRFPINAVLRKKIKETDHKKILLTFGSAQLSKPSEFHRAIRPLEFISYYKGTELRNFLLYYGMVALKEHANKDIYENFLTLHCAVTICSTNKFRKYIPVAKHLFEKFVSDYKKIYGHCMTSFNVHQLLHIADYVTKFGSLENYSAFQFESKLGVLVNQICSGNHPLQQAANRVTEHVELDIDDYIRIEAKFSKKKPIVGKKSIQFMDFVLKANGRDKWFQTKSNDIICFEGIKLGSEGEFQKIIGYRIKTKNDYYVKPMRSSLLDIYESDGILEQDKSFYNIEDVENKLFCIQDLYDKKIFFPILHTSPETN